MREFRAEVSIMSRLRHPNVVLFMVRQEGGRGVRREAMGDTLEDLWGGGL